MRYYLISGCPLEPSSSDLIAQVDCLPVGAVVPPGWRVLSGKDRVSEMARVVYRYELESGK